MTGNPHGPNAVCQRTRCTTDGPANHNGGAHLNPADRTHYDGISVSYNAAPYRVKEATAGLLRAVGALTGPPATTADSPTRTQVEIAVAACLSEIARLNQLVAHVRVDADHRILDASRRALDCTDHGQTITGLEHALTAANRRADRLEKARLALLGEHQAVADLTDAWKAGRLAADLTLDRLLGALETANRKTAALHKRAFNA